ncbi:MAG: hypothetical protein GY730_08305 [bacterium]|nr:hypothetical protein [bacterium]
MNEPFFIFKLIIYVVCIALLILLAYFIVEVIRIVIGARRIVDRVELMTDISSWLKILRKLPGRKKKKKQE